MNSSTLSRTSSAASVSSDDSTYLKQILGFEPRRTRKRFTSMQVMLLEQLFHQSSHPTREEREAVARAADMEMKSVTIWFQNKRQTERKALYHASSQSMDVHRTMSFPIPSSSPSALSSPYASTSTSTPVPGAATVSHPIRTHTRTLSTTHAHAHTPRRRITPPRTRPSLDRVATRSESRLPPPRTPTRPRDPHASLWDNMPSSPLAPPASPPAHDLIEFLGSSRTLEWACAAARLAEKEGRRRPCARDRDRDRDRRRYKGRYRSRDGDRDKDKDTDKGEVELGGAGDDTEEDDVEAVTPEGSLGVSGAAKWNGHGGQRLRPPLAPTLAPAVGGEHGPGKRVSQDEDMMRAALALCGLGRRGG